MSFATETNIKAIKEAAEKFPIVMSQWTLNKVWLCSTTNSIRARFKNESIGMIGGIVKPDFEVTTNMEIAEIEANVTLDKIVFRQNFDQLAEKVLGITIE